MQLLHLTILHWIFHISNLGVEDLLPAYVADTLAVGAFLTEFSTGSKLLSADSALLFHVEPISGVPAGRSK
jgi:hypothetical protein